MLIPNPQNKLQSTWEGHFRIIKKLNETKYVLALDEQGKRKKTVTMTVNMIKEYHDRNLPVLAVCPLPSEEDNKVMLNLLEVARHATDVHQVPFCSKLSQEQQVSMKNVVHHCHPMFSSWPGRMTLTIHHVETLQTRPIQQDPYRVPEAILNTIKHKLNKMLDLGIIQPSQSPWV